LSNDAIIAGLNPIAAANATAFLAKFPDAVLTSGRRTVKAQAAAVASAVAQQWDFIDKTYKHPLCAVAQACHDWARANCRSTCQQGDVISAAFEAILATFPDDELEKFSCHLGGNAFDVHSDGDPAKISGLTDLAAARNADGGSAKFLSREGSLIRWHFQAV
jgi:hypothetical protein